MFCLLVKKLWKSWQLESLVKGPKQMYCRHFQIWNVESRQTQEELGPGISMSTTLEETSG